ncbi:MAG: NADH-quinone oxidoreductase subunit [Segetibacter sp.]|jgi:NADH-quinone oxidoreductase subunit C|nr:NADH-quinone oxidoreductase subunit [Segetibacter sp.]
MPLTNPDIIQRLVDKFGEALTEFDEPYGMLTFAAPREMNLKVMRFLYDEPELGFQFLTDLCAVHYPERPGEELAVVYHLHNLVENVRLRFKVYLPIEQPDAFSATSMFESANWMERETYDFFGVNFIGHPNLKRILNVEEMDYFPMRKEFPLEDQSRIDKDDEMFGRGGTTDFGNREVNEEPRTISEADKDKTWI